MRSRRDLRRRSSWWWIAMVLACAGSVPRAVARAADEVPGEGRDLVAAGWDEESDARGDLDADGVEDRAVALLQERAEEPPESEGGPERRPRLLVIMKGQLDGGFRRVAASSGLLLCDTCFGAMGGRPHLTIERGVLIVSQTVGSRETIAARWRFRFDAALHRYRLIGLDVLVRDRPTGAEAWRSTNYLTGRQVIEQRRVRPPASRPIVVNSNATRMSRRPIFLEDTSAQDALAWTPELE